MPTKEIIHSILSLIYVHFNGHFLGEQELASSSLFLFWI